MITLRKMVRVMGCNQKPSEEAKREKKEEKEVAEKEKKISKKAF